MTTAALLWAGITLAAAAVALRTRQSPMERPLPTAVAVGGVFGLVAVAVGLQWRAQAVVVVLMTVGLAGLLLRWRALVAEDNLAPGVGGNRLLGRTGTVVTPVAPGDRSGTVRLGAETWPATATAGTSLPEGHPVTVVAVEGIHLVVRSAQPDPVHTPHDVAEPDPGG